MEIAIVTGASNGLGREFVFLLDKENLDEIWVIARRTKLLQTLQTAIKTPLRILSLDLIQRTSLDGLQRLLLQEKPAIRYLINAAGFGKIGKYDEIPLSALLDMIDLNGRAAIAITQISLPYMAVNSHILEICSVAAFQPIPFFNVYAASKAMLYRYSRALAMELSPRQIYVTAVCPYWIKDTGFIPIAQQTKSSAYFQHFPFAAKEADVARRAWQSAKRKNTVVTPSFFAWLERCAAKILPHSLMMRLSILFCRL